MLRVLKNRKLLIAAGLLLAAGLAVIYVLFLKPEKMSDYLTLESERISSELAKGKCSDETKSALKSAPNSENITEKAKLYEKQGLCFVYASDFPNALKAYKLSKEAYEKVGLKEDSARLDGAIAGVEPLTRPIPEKSADSNDDSVMAN